MGSSPHHDHASHAHHDHAHGHGVGHHHHHGSGRVLIFSLCFTLAFAVVELLGGYVADSLALISDAGHMFTDSSSLAIGAFAAWLARRPASRHHSFGLQRAEILGALINAVMMVGVIVAIAGFAIARLFSPEPVNGGLVLGIATIGLVVNLTIGAILLRGEKTLNVRSALLHVAGDLAGSVAAMVAGVVIIWTGWMPIDPILSLVVSALITVSVFPLLRDVCRVLMEGVPRDVDARHVSAALAGIDGVRAIHDLHVWTLSSRQRALAAHVEVARLADWETILPKLQALLADRFSITHTTLQPEDLQTAKQCAVDAGCGVTLAAPRAST